MRFSDSALWLWQLSFTLLQVVTHSIKEYVFFVSWVQYLLCSSGGGKCWKGKGSLAPARWVCMFGYALSPHKFIDNAKALFRVPVSTLNQWIEICCGNILFLFLPLVLPKSKIYPGQRVQTKIFYQCVNHRGESGWNGQTGALHHSWERLRESTVPVSWWEDAPYWCKPRGSHTQCSLQSGCGCSLSAAVPTSWTANSICCCCVYACEQVGFPPHSICSQAQAQLKGIQFFI